MFATRLLALVLAVAPLGACAPPTATPFATPVHPASRSWMRSGAKGGPLLYVTNAGGVTVYSNPSPNTFQLVGELFGFQDPAGAQFSLYGSGSATTILAPDNGYNNVEIYSYPSDSALGSVTSGISTPAAAVISE